MDSSRFAGRLKKISGMCVNDAWAAGSPAPHTGLVTATLSKFETIALPRGIAFFTTGKDRDGNQGRHDSGVHARTTWNFGPDLRGGDLGYLVTRSCEALRQPAAGLRSA